MGCKLSVDDASDLTRIDLGLHEADLAGWCVKQDHIECVALDAPILVPRPPMHRSWNENWEHLKVKFYRKGRASPLDIQSQCEKALKHLTQVEDKWLTELRSGVYRKPNGYVHGTHYERFLFLQRSNGEIPKLWRRISVKIYQKPLKQLRIPKVPKDHNFPSSDSFADLMSYVSTKNFENYLFQASKMYSSVPPVQDDAETDEISGKDVLEHIAKKVYNVKIIKLSDALMEDVSKQTTQDRSYEDDAMEEPLKCLAGLLTVYGVVESEHAYYIIEHFASHSLQDVAWFSPKVVSSTITKPLFLLYQILKVFTSFHALGYYCSIDSLRDVLLGNCLWLCISPTRVNVGETTTGELNEINSNAVFPASPAGDSQSFEERTSMRFEPGAAYEIPFSLQMLGLPQLVDLWVKKGISNFDYLMALNTIAGRRYGDPNYHPVLPWVTDFQSPTGRYRDLTKSKFRINKGDDQLDVTFKTVGDADEDLPENPPHHISGVLSEITYHVYLARRTPKSVLQKHVRTKWEPNEYPSSMQRLQEWTPDECIPEFYTDPTIFESLHTDLPDLGIPTWAESPQDFIVLHRKALESEYVCSHLHDWIDLTFGYKLVGLAAEKAKNVHLHLVDNHQSISNHGVVQLFEQPHPAQHRHHGMVLYPSTVNFEDGLEHELRDTGEEGRLCAVEEGQAEFPMNEMQPSDSWDNIYADVVIETGEDELNVSSSLKKQKSRSRSNFSTFLRLKEAVETSTDVLRDINALPISLPIGYGPLEEFDQVELLTKFKMQAKQCDSTRKDKCKTSPQVHVLSKSEVPETARREEIQNICSMIMEMFLPSRMRLLSPDLSRKEKFVHAKRVFHAGRNAVPGRENRHFTGKNDFRSSKEREVYQGRGRDKLFHVQTPADMVAMLTKGRSDLERHLTYGVKLDGAGMYFLKKNVKYFPMH